VGAALFLGKGAISSYLNKLKSNSRGSTEIELVAVNQYMPQMLWSLYFIRAQGWNMEHIELHQNNVSAELLEINGKFSCSSKTKHIKAKIFFVKDKVDDSDIVIKDCPTEVMWADIMTKPKQGKVFREMRAVLMNCHVNYIDKSDPRSGQGYDERSNGTRVLVKGVSSRALGELMRGVLSEKGGAIGSKHGAPKGKAKGGACARGLSTKKGGATGLQPGAAKRNAKGGLNGNVRPMAPVNQGQRHRPA